MSRSRLAAKLRRAGHVLGGIPLLAVCGITPELKHGCQPFRPGFVSGCARNAARTSLRRIGVCTPRYGMADFMYARMPVAFSGLAWSARPWRMADGSCIGHDERVPGGVEWLLRATGPPVPRVYLVIHVSQACCRPTWEVLLLRVKTFPGALSRPKLWQNSMHRRTFHCDPLSVARSRLPRKHVAQKKRMATRVRGKPGTALEAGVHCGDLRPRPLRHAGCRRVPSLQRAEDHWRP